MKEDEKKLRLVLVDCVVINNRDVHFSRGASVAVAVARCRCSRRFISFTYSNRFELVAETLEKKIARGRNNSRNKVNSTFVFRDPLGSYVRIRLKIAGMMTKNLATTADEFLTNF